jgi:iron complex transport system substrate-binding protein
MKHAPLNLFGLITLALILVACASATEVSAPQTSEETTAQTNMPPTKQPITIIDALGRTVTLEKLPSRIVIAGKGTVMIADALYLFPQASERVAAISLPFQGADFLSIVDPKYEEKIILDGQTGPEQVAAANPDVVLIKSYQAETLGYAIEALGIPVVTVDLETPDEYFTELQSLGALFGDQPRAQTVVDYYKRKMAVIQDNLSGFEDQRIRLRKIINFNNLMLFLLPA